MQFYMNFTVSSTPYFILAKLCIIKDNYYKSTHYLNLLSFKVQL